MARRSCTTSPRQAAARRGGEPSAWAEDETQVRVPRGAGQPARTLSEEKGSAEKDLEVEFWGIFEQNTFC